MRNNGSFSEEHEKKHPSVADFYPQRCLIWLQIKRGSINLSSNHWLAIFYSLYFIIYQQSPPPVYNETKINPLYSMCFSCPTAQWQQPVKSQDRLFNQLLTSITLLYSWMNIKRQGKNKKLVPVTFQKQSSHRLRGRMSVSERSHLSGPVTVNQKNKNFRSAQHVNLQDKHWGVHRTKNRL